MDHPSLDQTPLRPSPFQARALHFIKQLVRARGSGAKSRDTISPVALPTQGFQRAHSSVDLLRKPDISRLIGFRVENGPHPMDTDDSSQEASASSNSPRLRTRRHSASDSSRSAPIYTTFAAHGAASAFFRDQGFLGNKFPVDDGTVNLLAPAPLFLRSIPCLDAVPQPPQSPVSSPEIPLQISVAPESKPVNQAVQHMLNDDTARPLGDVLSHDATLMTPMTDLTLSTSSYPGTLSGPQSVPFPTSETVQERPPLLSRHSAPLPPPFRVMTERGLRLSPSIVTRQPMPLLNLPTLPPPPPPPSPTPRQKLPLRSIPSLSRHGHSNVECQAHHENATLGDSDEDDVDEGDEVEEFIDALSAHQSDDDDEEPSSAGTSGIHGFKTLQKQRMRDDGPLVEHPVSPTLPQSDPVSPDPADYLCSKTYINSIRSAPSSTSLAMYPFSPDIPSAEDANQRHALEPDIPIPGARLESRPSLYRVASRSMVNLGPTRRAELGRHSLKSRETMQSNAGSASGHTFESSAESEESDTEAVIGRLLRRTSMPSFHPTSDPPPYPSFDPRPKEIRMTPHEDEELPSYSNSLYLIAIMPRKVEFSAPGVQAKDRKWRRMVCELEGTTFRVYKCPPGASGAGVLGDWWEKRVGVGDVSSSTPRTRQKEEQFERSTKMAIDGPSTPITPSASSGRSTSVPPVRHSRRSSESQWSMASQSTMTSTPRPAKRTSGTNFLSPFRSSSSTQPETSTGESSRRPEPRELELLPVDVQSSRSSLSHESGGRATPAAQQLSQPPQPRSASRLTFLPVATGRAQWRNGEIPKPPKSDLLRAYTLQHAESGLGSDYLKRKNVIRVRLEGEQFLLQAPDVPAVVEWIEGLHAGTNIALDIDQRPMPRGPMFPRRRRRRTRQTQSAERPSTPERPA